MGKIKTAISANVNLKEEGLHIGISMRRPSVRYSSVLLEHLVHYAAEIEGGEVVLQRLRAADHLERAVLAEQDLRRAQAAVVVVARILTVYPSINAKRSPHALYQNMRT